MYDLWRNEKISRISPCNLFSMAEGKGKKWVAMDQNISFSSIYTNRGTFLFIQIILFSCLSTGQTSQYQKPNKYRHNCFRKLSNCKGTPGRVHKLTFMLLGIFSFFLIILMDFKLSTKKVTKKIKYSISSPTFNLPNYTIETLMSLILEELFIPFKEIMALL